MKITVYYALGRLPERLISRLHKRVPGTAQANLQSAPVDDAGKRHGLTAHVDGAGTLHRQSLLPSESA